MKLEIVEKELDQVDVELSNIRLGEVLGVKRRYLEEELEKSN